MFLSCFSHFLRERFGLGLASCLGLGIGLALGDRVKVRFEVRVVYLHNCYRKCKQKMAALWHISVVLQFLNKVLKAYEIDKFLNNCTVHH